MTFAVRALIIRWHFFRAVYNEQIDRTFFSLPAGGRVAPAKPWEAMDHLDSRAVRSGAALRHPEPDGYVMRPVPIEQVNNEIPIFPKREQSIIHGIHGAIVQCLLMPE